MALVCHCGLILPFLPKVVSVTGSTQQLHLDRFGTGVANEVLCPVRALQTYVRATAGLQKSDNLFVCYVGPRKGRALSTQRLSKLWRPLNELMPHRAG